MSYRNRISRLALMSLAALVLASAACAEGAGAKGAAAQKPWYAPVLEKLGFTVFEKPIALPDDLAFESLDGTSVKPGDSKGKLLILHFWATWAGPSMRPLPALEGLLMYARAKGLPLTVMSVDVNEEKEKVERYLKAYSYRFPVCIDPNGAVAAVFGIDAVPAVYVVDKSGLVIGGMLGPLAYDSDAALEAFQRLASR